MTVALPESTGLATHTHTTEGGTPTASTSTRPTLIKGVAPKIKNLNRNAIAESRVRMHMRKCPSHRGIKIKINIMRGVLDLALGGVSEWQGDEREHGTEQSLGLGPNVRQYEPSRL